MNVTIFEKEVAAFFTADEMSEMKAIFAKIEKEQDSNAVLDLEGAFLDVAVEKAMQFHTYGEPEVSLSILNALALLFPTQVCVYLNLAEMMMEMGNYPKAEFFMDKVIELSEECDFLKSWKKEIPFVSEVESLEA